MHRIRTLSLLAAAVFSSDVVASERHWSDLSGGLWHDSANWLEGSVPLAGDQAIFDLGATTAYPIGVDRATFLTQLLIGNDRVAINALGYRFAVLPTDYASARPTPPTDDYYVSLGLESGDTSELRLLGGSIWARIFRVGAAAGSAATLWVDGTNGSPTLLALNRYGDGAFYVGDRGDGIATFTNGGAMTTTRGYIGRKIGAEGVLTVTSGGDINFEEGLYIGGDVTVAGGTGSVLVGDGGRLYSHDIRLWSGGTLTLDGGQLEVGNIQLSGGQFDWQSGFFQISGHRRIGTNQLLGRHLTLNSDKSLRVSSSLTIDSGASLTLSEGGTLQTPNLINNGTFTFTGGELLLYRALTVGDDTLFTPKTLEFMTGQSLGLGTLTVPEDATFKMRGGRLQTEDAQVAGVVELDNVQWSTWQPITVDSTTGPASLRVSGASVVEPTDTIYAGRSATGHFTQDGGTVGEVTPLQILLGETATGDGRYTMGADADKLRAREVVVGKAGTGTFTQHGGKVEIRQSHFALPLGVFVGQEAGAVGTYELTGGELDGWDSASLIVGESGEGTFNQSGGTATMFGFRLGNATSGEGQYHLSDGSLTVQYQTYIGHSGTGEFIQQGGSYSLPQGGLYLGYYESGEGTVDITGGVFEVGSDVTSQMSVSIGYLGKGTLKVGGGEFRVPTALIQTGPSQGNRIEVSGGKLLARQLSLGSGYQGASSTMLQTGGEVTLTETNRRAYPGTLAIGFGGGQHSYRLDAGKLTVAGQAHAGVWSNGSSFFDQRGGEATFDEFQAGISGGYLLSGGTATFEDVLLTNPYDQITRTQFDHSAGDSTVGLLRIQPRTRYVYRGGDLTIQRGAIIEGEFSFGSASTTLTIEDGGYANFSKGKLLAGQSASIVAGANTLLSFPAGFSLSDLASLETQGIVHVAGQPLTITSNTSIRSGGTLVGAITNSGSLSPGSSPGVLRVEGSYVQSAAGTLKVEIAGLADGTTANIPAEFDQLFATGSNELAGLLDIDLLDGFLPASDAKFVVLSAPNVAGSFANAATTVVFEGGMFDIQYNRTRGEVVLTNFQAGVPEPATIGAMLMASVILASRRRRRSPHA